MAKVSAAVRTRAAIVGATVLGVVALFAVLPVFGSGHPDADRLRLTDDTRSFYYGAIDPLAATSTQAVSLGAKGCLIDPVTGPLVTLASNSGGANKGPGYVDFGIGVKTGGSNGTPCSEVDGSELLEITSANMWSKLRLDLQVKGDVHVLLDLLDADGEVIDTHELLTGAAIETFAETVADTELPYTATTTAADKVEACADPNDSGPDANIKDNCLWTVEPGFAFKAIRLSAKDGVGAVSLEGGADYEAFDPDGFSNGDFDSLFYRALAPADDSYTTDEDTALNVSEPGVLANDGSTSGVTLTVTNNVDNGSLALDDDGSFTYTPNPNYNGPDSFVYLADNGIESGSATVNITVNSVNDDPVPKNTPLTATEDTPKTYSGSDLATDDDGDAIVIDAASATGSTKLNDDGTVTYTPDSNFCGSDTLEFTVSDGKGGTASGSVTINIACQNDAPVAADDSYETDERSAPLVPVTLTVPSASGVLANDTDVDDTSLSASNATTTAHGATVVLNSDGSFTYTPALKTDAQWEAIGAFEYDDSWGYTLSDPGGLTDTGTVTVTVHRVICSDETVTDVDGDISGSFTLLSDVTNCKRYGVDADAATQTVTFAPDPRGGEDAFFRGLLSFEPQTLDGNGTFSLGLEYDPDGDGLYQTLQVCIDPVFGADGLITSATIPTLETWCFGGETSLASATTPGLIETVFQVYGEEDPGFRFK